MISNLGQLFFIGIEGTELSAKEAAFITENDIGGVSLFARNLKDPAQIHKLCSDLNNLKSKTPSRMPLYVAVDMEGGRVHRLKPPFTQWPSLGKLAKLDSTAIAFKFSNMMGEELRSVGINMDYAPCVDVLTNDKNVLIGDRSLGRDPEFVGKMASALVRGYIKADITPCAKHFPGHGNTIIDSHEDLPIEEVDLKTLEEREMIPFKRAIRARMDFVMTAHIKYNKVDPEHPATLSPVIIKKLLKENLRFRNLVITDDLDMKALTKNYAREEIPVLALQAGCDVLLYCNEFTSPPIGLEAVKKAITDQKVSAAQVQASIAKIIQLKKETICKITIPPYAEATKWIGHTDHIRLSQAINSGNVPEDLRVT